MKRLLLAVGFASAAAFAFDRAPVELPQVGDTTSIQAGPSVSQYQAERQRIIERRQGKASLRRSPR